MSEINLRPGKAAGFESVVMAPRARLVDKGLLRRYRRKRLHGLAPGNPGQPAQNEEVFHVDLLARGSPRRREQDTLPGVYVQCAIVSIR